MQTSDYVRSLPDVYEKGKGTTNWKLLSLESDLVTSFRDDVAAVDKSLDIYSVTGKTLDLFGAMVGEPRNGASDEQYRYMILGKINRSFCKGDYNSTVEQLAIIFKCDKSEFSFIEDPDNCVVTLESFPMEIVLGVGLTSKQMMDIIEALLPIGVGLIPFELGGTFAFGSTEDEYDENAGFADEAQTIGGYLGAISGEF